MQATIEEIGPCRKKISVEIDVAQVRLKLDEKYAEFLKTASIAGFRKGHVPRGLAEKRFGKEIRAEVQEALMAEALKETVEEHKLEPIGNPAFDKVSFEEDKPLTYEVTLSVKPLFELANYKGIEATRPSAEVAEREIDLEVEALRRRAAQLVPVEGGPVEKDHHLLVSFKLTEGGKEVGSRDSAHVVLEEDTLFGMPCKGLADHFAGRRTGDSVDVTVTLPDWFPKEEHRNKEAVAACKILDIKRLELPAADDAWAKTMNYDSIADVRDDIKKHLGRRKKIDADVAVEDEIVGKIMAANDFALPEEMVRHEVDRFVERRRMMFEGRGLAAAEVEERLKEAREQRSELQRRETKAFFILERIAKEERIFATEAEVEERIAEIAASRNRRPSEVKHELEESDSMSLLRTEIREEKTRAFLREQAVISEAPAPAAEKKAKAEEKAEAKEEKPVAKVEKPKKSRRSKKEQDA